jgi:hypothetical protein
MWSVSFCVYSLVWSLFSVHTFSNSFSAISPFNYTQLNRSLGFVTEARLSRKDEQNRGIDCAPMPFSMACISKIMTIERQAPRDGRALFLVL